MAFEFDASKSIVNKAKHGIDFVEAQEIWADEQSIDLASYASGETRRLAVGLIGKRHWTAVWTMRGGSIRIILVRRSRKDEVQTWLDA